MTDNMKNVCYWLDETEDPDKLFIITFSFIVRFTTLISKNW